MHYSPIRATVEGEPPEIFPYLGSSRLEEPINRYRVTAVFHGHAHRGTAEGRTSTGVPVYNVAMPLLARLNPDRPPYLVVELPLDDDAPRVAAAGAARRAGGQDGVKLAMQPQRGDHVIDTAAPLLTTPEKAELYRTALEMLNRSGVPYMVGGTYAFQVLRGHRAHDQGLRHLRAAARRAARARRARARRLQDRDRVHATGWPRRITATSSST